MLNDGGETNMLIARCQNVSLVGNKWSREKIMVSCGTFIIAGFLDGFERTEDVVLQCLRLRLLDEFIVGYIRQRKLQRLLISLRLHAGCRKDN